MNTIKYMYIPLYKAHTQSQQMYYAHITHKLYNTGNYLCATLWLLTLIDFEKSCHRRRQRNSRMSAFTRM